MITIHKFRLGGQWTRSCLSALLLVASVPTVVDANANPPSTINFLMNEPVTMFDLGIDRIQNALTQLRSQHLDKDGGKICTTVGHCVQLPDNVKLMGPFPVYEFDKNSLIWELMTGCLMRSQGPKMSFEIVVPWPSLCFARTCSRTYLLYMNRFIRGG